MPRRLPTPTTLRYSLAPCSLGTLLLAASERGVCALLFGEDAQALLSDMHARFPDATAVADPEGLAAWVAQVRRQLDDPRQPAELPLDLCGSAFQQGVWQALRAIPCGETRRYGQLARLLGSHARAVAGACARNPVGLLVPCHRVLGAGDALTGYRWGLPRKAALLAGERAGRPAGA